MTSKQPTEPGENRTWWPLLLARLLRHLIATAYEVQDEVLGRRPLRKVVMGKGMKRSRFFSPAFPGPRRCALANATEKR